MLAHGGFRRKRLQRRCAPRPPLRNPFAGSSIARAAGPCRLRPRPHADGNRFAELLEEYVDLDTGEARRFYRPLLMIFNGQKVVLQ